MINKDLPHQIRRDREKMGSAFKAQVLLRAELKVRLVDQFGRLQGPILIFTAQIIVRPPMQLSVDDRDQLLKTRFLFTIRHKIDITCLPRE
jgi:hypothetical protein